MMHLRLTRTGMIRALVDMVLVNLSLILAFIFRILYFIWFEEPVPGVIQIVLKTYLTNSWILTLISFVVFFLSGFYTFSRTYYGRYKAVIVIQAVVLSYLLFGFITYFTYSLPIVPRSVLLMAWLLTTLALLGVRFAVHLWADMVKAESQLRNQGKIESKIERILVIGGAGYIGSILVQKLLKRGYHVRVLDKLFFGTEPIEEALKSSRFELVQGDFRNIETVVSAIQGVDAVVHLGGLVGDPACALDEQLSIEINSLATRMIAAAAKGYGVQRFLFASTCSVYGAGDEVFDEKSKLNPVSLYAKTKIDSENVLLEMNDDNFTPVILRFATIYGLSPRPRFDLVVNLLVAKAMFEGEITIFGGDQWRPFLHVDDAAEALLHCLEAPHSVVKGQIFNIGSDTQNFQINQIGEIIKHFVPQAKLIHKGEDTDRRNYHVRFDRLKNLLNFVPKKTIEDGIKEIQESIANGQIVDYRDRHYNNYVFLASGLQDDDDNFLDTYSNSPLILAKSYPPVRGEFNFEVVQ
jgi:nucleoside-diphosphate-sugar epimerase